MNNKNKEIKKPNIIFIVTDALRAKNLGCYGYHRKTSPNIDNLAKQGVLFENAFSSSNVTEKSFLSMLSGRHVLTEDKSIGFFTKKELSSFFNSGGIFLQEILKKKGYKTYCLKFLFGWHRIGFDYYFKSISKKWNLIKFITKNPVASKISNYLCYIAPKIIENKIRSKPGGERVTKEAINIIKKNGKKHNFFIKIDYEDTHMPYNANQFSNKFIAKNKGENFFKIISKNYAHNKKFIKFCKNAFNKNDGINEVIARYDSAIFYDDYLIGQIIDTLKKEKLFENTIIFFFSDHGESINEHGVYVNHNHLYDVSMNVPLIILGKGIPQNKKINSLIQLKDITPTVLDLLNINYNPTFFDGKSLSPLISGRKKELRDLIFIEENIAIKRRGIRTKKYKYIEFLLTKNEPIPQDIIQLYDLEKDPAENINIAKTNKKALMEMKLKFDKKIKEMRNINEKRRIKMALSDALKTKSL